MADFDNNKPTETSANGSDIISDLDALSKKYGVSSGTSVSGARPVSTGSTRAYTPPRNNNPARTPRMVYDADIPGGGIRIVYGDEDDMPKGPEGRRVIYSESESESIAEKRRRNAQRSAKGSQGFGSQPYVRHVASSPAAIRRDDEETFSRAYKIKKETEKTTETEAKQEITETPVKESKVRLVATNPDYEKKKTSVHKHYEKSAGEKAALFFKAFIPWKGDSAKEVIRKIIMNVSAILVLVCFGYFVDNYIQHQEELQKQEEIKNNIPEVETVDDLEAKWAEKKAMYPDVVFPDGMNIKWADLYAKNQDLIGWLKIDNTNIDTAVMHTPSDKDKNTEDFYLRRNFYKKDDKYGTPYLEKHNTGKTLDRNNTIYGHNMMDGLSFAQLEKYYTIDGFRQSPIIKYSTIYEDYYFKVYAAFITNGYPSGDNGYLFNYNISHFPSVENFEKFIEAIDERKLYDTGVDITKDDKLLVLSTCSYEINKTDMGRLAVVGRLVRPGENISVDTSKAVANDNIRYPQIWYDEHNISNPYKNAYQWIPE